MGGAEIIWLRKRNSGCETGVCESGVQRPLLVPTSSSSWAQATCHTCLRVPSGPPETMIKKGMRVTGLQRLPQPRVILPSPTVLQPRVGGLLCTMTVMLMTTIRHVTSVIHTTSYTDDYGQPDSPKYHQHPGAQGDVSMHF